MFELKEKLKPILDEYYGNGFDNEKDHIMDFLETNGDVVLPILKEEFEEE